MDYVNSKNEIRCDVRDNGTCKPAPYCDYSIHDTCDCRNCETVVFKREEKYHPEKGGGIES